MFVRRDSAASGLGDCRSRSPAQFRSVHALNSLGPVGVRVEIPPTAWRHASTCSRGEGGATVALASAEPHPAGAPTGKRISGRPAKRAMAICGRGRASCSRGCRPVGDVGRLFHLGWLCALLRRRFFPDTQSLTRSLPSLSGSSEACPRGRRIPKTSLKSESLTGFLCRRAHCRVRLHRRRFESGLIGDRLRRQPRTKCLFGQPASASVPRTCGRRPLVPPSSRHALGRHITSTLTATPWAGRESSFAACCSRSCNP